MSVSVSVRSYTHSVTFVTDNILKSLKDVIRLSDLDPQQFVSSWEVLHSGISRWIESGHLERISLEVYDPTSDRLLGRWDVEISHAYSADDGEFWVDTDAIRFAIRKAGVLPGNAKYDVKVTRKPGYPAVAGWVSCSFRSTEGFVQQRIGTTINGSGLTGGVSYLRKA
jgi:hypothetical protein